MATIFSEDFESDGNGTRYETSTLEFTDGSGDFFTRTDGTNIGSFYNVTGFGGSSYFAAMDLDGEGASLPLTLTFNNIDISGFSDLAFSVDLAEDDDGSNQDWDLTDFVKFEYRIDGGAFQNLLAVESIPDGDNFNAVPAIDTDFDGNGDGTEITDTFATFVASIAGTGSSLDLRTTYNLNSGDEDLSIDNLKIESTSPHNDGGGETTPQIVISEIMYNAASAEDDWEWIELYNDGTNPIDLSGWVIDDGNSIAHSSANIAAGTIAAGSTAVLYNADDLSQADFEAAWGTGINLVAVTEWNNLALNNGGDTVSLWQDFVSYNGDNTTHANALATVAYDDSGDWPSDDGNGSIFLTDLSAETNDGTNWALSTEGASTPAGGAAYTSKDDGGNSGTDVGSPGGTLSLPPTPAPYSFDFESSFTDEGWQVVSVDADTGNTWFPDDFSSDNFAEVNAFGDTAPADDWLISPEIDLSALTNPVASFANTKNYEDDGLTNPEVSFLYSTDYSGSGDPSAATWSELPYNASTGGYTEVDSGALDLSEIAGNTATFAFRYQSSGTSGGSSSLWQIDDFAVGETSGSPSDVKIHEVQGNGDTSPLVGQLVTVEAIVVGDFQEGDADTGRNLDGFYLQEEDADADGNALTSEGIFVYEGVFDTDNDVNVGDLVRVTGTVDEFFGETQIDTVTSINIVSSNNTLPTAATVTLPAAGTTLSEDDDVQPNLEHHEGMLVSFADTLTINEMYQLDRFNEIKLVQGERPEQFTQSNTPSVAGYEAHLQDVGARQITYDDGLNVQNAPIGNLDGFQGFADGNAPSMGDTIDNLTGVLDYKWAGNGASGATWRVRSTEDGENTFDDSNPRPAAPANVGGDLKVAAFNVLNYFATIDDGSTNTAIGAGPRGADDLTRFSDTGLAGTDSRAEIERQTDKLVTSMLEIDADIYGLTELENDFLSGASGNAIETLVQELNAVAGPGTFDWVDPGQRFVDVSDAISVGAIYKPASVSIAPGTSVAVLNDADLPASFAGETIFDGPSTNRAPIAVTFEENATGEAFTLAVNHFKSKGSIFSESGNTAAGDGAGNNNQIRLEAAQAVDEWLQTDPTGSGDDDFLILGDLNAYAQEDPIVALEDAGYTDLAEAFEPDGFSFVFDGQVGTLDYAMANPDLFTQVTGATTWNINADEADALDYNLDFGRDPNYFDGSTPYRSSDHDPIIVGLDLQAPAPERLLVEGSENRDYLVGSDEAEIIAGRGGFGDLLAGGDGEDIFYFDTIGDGARDYARVLDFEAGFDSIQLENDNYDVLLTSRYARIYTGDENDLILVGGNFEDINALGINVGPIDGLFV